MPNFRIFNSKKEISDWELDTREVGMDYKVEYNEDQFPLIIDMSNPTYKYNLDQADEHIYQAMSIPELIKFLAENADEIKLPLNLINCCIPKEISSKEGDE
jgi:deoxycytidine triphosphate deaminase